MSRHMVLNQPIFCANKVYANGGEDGVLMIPRYLVLESDLNSSSLVIGQLEFIERWLVRVRQWCLQTSDVGPQYP